ncbi:NAD(P)-dependent oxidoreductase [Pusillimonas sp. T7-7]|uniref:NAD(P)-dependent oxidoreductase n=1 Tax=Pusillimonas sp. (strain T7-7) TaxID=1007105 RepID=UPI0005A28EB7|nr:NAD(P)-dependent oxidoreductase [Pusillimonas sp. T7-7]
MSVVAFVGLGAMGLPMAKNLLAKGFEVRGADLNALALDDLVEAGGIRTGSVAEAAHNADVLVLMVVNAKQAEHILMQANVLDGLGVNGVVCLMSTCPSADVQRLHKLVAEQNRRFVDAPVSGGVVGAKAGSLTIMAAADQASFDLVQDVFRALGERIFHVGLEPGQGAIVKTVNQLLCGVHIAVMAEAFSLASKANIDLELLLEIMRGSSASSWMLNDRGPRMLQDDPEVSSAVDIFVKDLNIVLETGRDVRAALPVAAAAHQMFLATSGRGDGQADDSQVIRSYYALNMAAAQ